MKRKIFGVILAALISIAILGGLFMLVDWPDLLSKFTPELAAPLALGSGLYCLTLLLRSLRFKLLLSKICEKNISFMGAFDLMSLNNLGNHLLPLRLGEVVLLGLAKTQHGLALDRAIAALFLARLSDLAVLLLGLGAVFFALDISAILGVALFACGLVGVFFVIRTDLAVKVTHKVLSVLLSPKLFGRFEKLSSKADSILSKLSQLSEVVASRSLYVMNVGFAILIWVVNTLSFWSVVDGMNIVLDFFRVFCASAGAAILPSLPVNALGTLGPLEAGWTAGFVAVGVSASDAASSGLVVHAMILVVALACALVSFSRVGTATLRRVLGRGDSDG